VILLLDKGEHVAPEHAAVASALSFALADRKDKNIDCHLTNLPQMPRCNYGKVFYETRLCWHVCIHSLVFSDCNLDIPASPIFALQKLW